MSNADRIYREGELRRTPWLEWGSQIDEQVGNWSHCNVQIQRTWKNFRSDSERIGSFAATCRCTGNFIIRAGVATSDSDIQW